MQLLNFLVPFLQICWHANAVVEHTLSDSDSYKEINSAQNLQLDASFANMHSSVATQKKRKKNSNTKRLSRAQLMSRSIHKIEVGSELYHRWWAGPEHQNRFKLFSWSANHDYHNNAIFSCLFSLSSLVNMSISQSPNITQRLVLFLRSARKVYSGDIVMAIPALISPTIQRLLVNHSVVVYEIPPDLCDEDTLTTAGARIRDIRCGSTDERVPSDVFKHYFFERWALQYNRSSTILIADVTDTFIQSDPFASPARGWHQTAPYDWRRESPLLLFTHYYPNSILNRLGGLGAVYIECYGVDALIRNGHRPVVSVSTMYGTRDAVVIWTRAVTVELQEAPGRYADSGCAGANILHAIVNWLPTSPKLKAVLPVALVPQGEGVVNLLAGLTGSLLMQWDGASTGHDLMGALERVDIDSRPALTGSLRRFWRVLDDDGRVRNWSGAVPPVVIYSDEALLEILASNAAANGSIHSVGAGLPE